MGMLLAPHTGQDGLSVLLEAGLQLLQNADKSVRVKLVLDWVLPFQRTQSQLETLRKRIRRHEFGCVCTHLCQTKSRTEKDVISNTFLLLLQPRRRPRSSIDGCVDVGGVRLVRLVLGSSVRVHRRDGGFRVSPSQQFSPRRYESSRQFQSPEK